MIRARVNASEGESDLYISILSTNVWRETVVTDYIKKRMSIQKATTVISVRTECGERDGERERREEERHRRRGR